MTFQTSQVVGFLAGGILVATLGAYRSLALDALSFCLPAALITGWVRPRPPFWPPNGAATAASSQG